MAWAARAIGAIAAIATAACTLLNPLDGLSDGVDPGTLDDGGGTPAEAASDAGVMIAPDAGSDGTSTVDGGDAATGSRYAAAVLADSPVLYYRFGDKSGSGARDEVSGTSTPYPVTGLTFGTPGALAGDPDTAVTTDGTGALQLTQDVDFEGLLPHSIEAWVSPSPAGNALGFLVDHENWTSTREGWLFRVGTGDFTYERYSNVPDASPGVGAVGATLTAVTGVWHYLVATFDGTTMRLYVDGVRQDSRDTSVPVPKIGMPFAVGKQNCACGGTGFAGVMDELAIYPKALAEDRIAAHLAAAR